MLNLVAEAGTHNAFHIGLILTTFGFGFRHGIDWDHIAALTDITSSQDDSRRSMFFATLYALGHALVVFILGFAAIVFAEELPRAADTVMERFVGATLIGLGIYVFYALLKHGRDFRMRSRWMLLFSGIRRGVRWARGRHPGSDAVEVVHDHGHTTAEHDHATTLHPAGAPGDAAVSTQHHPHRHRHLLPMPDDPFLNYGKATAFGVGMIHGVGAETPTQVLIFLTAAGAGGRGAGVLLLACFLAGLLSSNTLIAVAGTFGFLGASRNFKLYVTVSVLTATFSLVIGTVFLFGRSTLLPAIFGG
jgi:hypothetical protein